MSPSYNIPKIQSAAVVASIGAPIEIKHDHPVKQASELAPGECLVKMEYTGVCHTDLHAKKGDWPAKPNNPLIGGHEGVGVIVAIGANSERPPVAVGDRVGIKWLANSCLDCEFCRKGFEQNCVRAQLSGYTVDGTFSQYVVSYVHHVTKIPEGFDSAAAASILCAGVTVYRALKNSNAHIGDFIVLPGAGGGLGHLAVQYAVNMGLRVIAIDTGAEKHKLVMSLGAEKWIDFKESKDIVKDIKDATGGFGAHAALVTASVVSQGLRHEVPLALNVIAYFRVRHTSKLSTTFVRRELSWLSDFRMHPLARTSSGRFSSPLPSSAHTSETAKTRLRRLKSPRQGR